MLLFKTYKAGRLDALKDMTKLLRAVDFSAGLPEELALRASKLNGAQGTVMGAKTMCAATADWMEEAINKDADKELSAEAVKRAVEIAKGILDKLGP